MCMLFAVSSNENFRANEYLKLFYSNSDKHPHGWGLACVDSESVTIDKESAQASKSHYLKEHLNEPIESKILLAHIRYATIGNVEYKNCHPFTGRDNRSGRWTMIHNGTVFDCPALSKYTKAQVGDTDSERIFLYFIDSINELQDKRKLRFEERFTLLDKLICSMAPNNKLNLLFTDGKYLYVHTNCKDTLFYLEKEGTTIFATAPLTNENWRNVKFCTLLAFKNGRLVKEGTTHTGEYIESPENIEMLYRIFSNL